MAYETLELYQTGYLATIKLNRPEKLNALNTRLAEEIHAALDDVAGQYPDIRVLIITGEGRGFCSGADVGDMAQGLSQSTAQRPLPDDDATAGLSPIVTLAPHLRSIPQPVIAAINGVAAGAGLSITLACDMRIASDQARFSCIFVKRSLVPDAGSSHTLPALVGIGVATEMALTGKVYDAHWALDVGLVNKVVPMHMLMHEAETLGLEISANPPLAVQASKKLLYADRDLTDVLAIEHLAGAPLRNTEDQLEAMISFVENRAPLFRGR